MIEDNFVLEYYNQKFEIAKYVIWLPLQCLQVVSLRLIAIYLTIFMVVGKNFPLKIGEGDIDGTMTHVTRYNHIVRI